MNKYKLTQDLLWYKKGTVLETDGESVWITQPGTRKIRTIDPLAIILIANAPEEGSEEWFEPINEPYIFEKASKCPYGNPDCPQCNPKSDKIGLDKEAAACPYNPKNMNIKEIEPLKRTKSAGLYKDGYFIEERELEDKVDQLIKAVNELRKA